MRISMALYSIAFWLVLSFTGAAQQPGAEAPASVVAPVHPITEATLRRYFEACHFDVRNRESLEAQFEAQRLQLPAWYPKAVWDEIVKTIEEMDVVDIALPVYQRYISEEAAQNAILLFVTPEGQAMVKKVYDQAIQHESSGDSALEARRKALAALQDEEDAKIHKMLDSMTPQQHRAVEAFVRSEEWKRMNANSGQLAKEFNSVLIARQEQIAKEITQSHQEEFAKAIREYRAAHPDASDLPQ
jgi:hypothetical protein